MTEDKTSDLKTIFDAIKAKAPRYQNLQNYYEGNQPQVYLTKRLREIFKDMDLVFSENWCAVVIDSEKERINLVGFEAADAAVKTLLSEAFERNNLLIESDDVHLDALVISECFAIAWPGEGGKAEIYYNDPKIVHCLYEPSNPRKMRCAGKIWEEDGQTHLTIYYPDRLEYYIADKKFSDISSAGTFQPDKGSGEEGKANNPYQRIPVFHFRTNRKGIGDLQNVIPVQNGINKLLSDMIVAAEFGAFSQRWVISNADTKQLKNAPNEIWNIPAGDGVGQQTSVGQFNPTDLKNYFEAIDRLALGIGITTRTPKHYFYGQSGDLSGEALIAMEGPLNKKAQDRIDHFKPVWRDLATFVCQIENVSADPLTITPVFEKPETIQPKTQADIIKIQTEAGVPLRTTLRWAGKTNTEIAAMETDQEQDRSKSQTSLANALLEAERQSRQAALNTQSGTNQPGGNGNSNQNSGG